LVDSRGGGEGEKICRNTVITVLIGLQNVLFGSLVAFRKRIETDHAYNRRFIHTSGVSRIRKIKIRHTRRKNSLYFRVREIKLISTGSILKNALITYGN
jgi:hypothetical protein